MDKLIIAERKLAGDCIYCGNKGGGLEKTSNRNKYIAHAQKKDRTSLWYCTKAPTIKAGEKCVDKWRSKWH